MVSLLQRIFWCTFLQVLFPWVFLRGLSFLFRGSVLPCSLSHRRCPGAHPRELFPCASLQWFFVFFACTLSQGLFPVRPFARVFSVCFAAQVFVCPQSRDYSRTLFRMAFPVGSLTGISCLNFFCRAFPMVFPRCIFRANFRMDGFHGLFRWVAYSALSRGWFFGSIFSGSISVQFFAGKTSMRAFAGAFCALFLKGFVCAILCRNFLPALFGRVFFRALFCMCFSRGLFLAAFTVLSFLGLFSLALFRSGVINRFIPRNFFCALLRSGFFGTLFRRSFCTVLFCRGFFHDRFQKASSALSLAGIFAWAFRRGISCALFRMEGFQ